MQDFEKLGLFYLGRRFDPASAQPSPDLVMYESRDLVTHAVCVGMTGSGKTGLCLAMIEEAAIDGVPVIAIDPKGDLGNLLLTFPSLAGHEFRPWIDEEEARRLGQTPDAFADAEAARWKAGLADWGQDGARISRLREAAEFAIYTPGSRAGLPVSILSSFAAPPPAVRADLEALAERATNTAASLLALAAVAAQPRSREHTLLASVLTAAWRDGRDLDLPALIQQIQSPPFKKVGVLDVDAFFPEKDRFALAMQINSLLAAPGFSQWMDGASLDPARLLYTDRGKPRVAIFSIAHLDDEQRMFFVSLLLNQVLAWARAQSGTSSLRALLYMDEIAGFFPPVANPPSKAPLLTLLKQARAYGLGVVLATQNPVDLDYKGLSNTGTWLLGRLQTERDKARVLDGLEGAAAGGMDRAETARLLSSLGKRTFLLHDIHQPAPLVFQSRWALSYLRGPLSRQQIARLMPPAATVTDGAFMPTSAAAPAPPSHTPRASAALLDTAPPVLAPGIEQFFVPAGTSTGSAPRYRPVLLGAARVGYGDSKLGIDEVRDVAYAASIGEGAVAVDWGMAEPLEVRASDLSRTPEPGAVYEAVPSAGQQPRNYTAWAKAFARWLGQAEKLELMRQRDLKMTSHAGESERDFRVRVQEAQRVARDAAVDAVRKRFESKRQRLIDQCRRAEEAVSRESAQASQQRLQTGLSVGATIFGALFGRKRLSASTLGRATTAARGVGRSMKESDDIERAAGQVKMLEQKAQALDAEIADETRRIQDRFEPIAPLESLSIAPKRGQVSVQVVGLGWIAEPGSSG